MKKTFRERWISQCSTIVKHHNWLKFPMFACMTAVLSMYYACIHFQENGKRYASLVIVLLFLTVNSSFTFREPSAQKPAAENAEDVQVTLTEENTSDDSDVVLLDDADVMEGFDDVELVGADNLDTFTLDEILEGNDSYKDKSRKEGVQDIAGGYQFDRNDWRIMLINKQHPIPEDYEFPLGTIKGSLQCDERIIEDLFAMMQAAKTDGVDLVICSPYRDYNRQTILFNRKINNYMKSGMSYMDAYKYSSMAVTSPNASEHQVGLAIDFYSSSYKVLDEGFSETETGQWLAANSYEYGFILRYPKEKEYITGIEYEPWHFRYVGEEAAAVITKSGITLEEFWEDL